MTAQPSHRASHRAKPAFSPFTPRDVNWADPPLHPNHPLEAFRNADVLSMRGMPRHAIEALIDSAAAIKAQFKDVVAAKPLAGKILGSLFFSTSTRTRLSFEAAMIRMGGGVVGFSTKEASRLGALQPESLEDTATCISAYCDIAVMRHPDVGTPKLFAEHCGVPVINGGDGIGAGSEHPTQTMIDLFTMQERLGRIDGLKILMIGGLHLRAAHSLLHALCAFDKVKVYLLSDAPGRLPDAEQHAIDAAGLDWECVSDVADVAAEVDVIYHNAMGEHAYYIVKPQFLIDHASVARAKPELIVMHPLDRRCEIPASFDNSPHSVYFQQAANGVPLRMALMNAMIGDPLAL
ncbi:aspartate carbamoyltransferase [Dongia sp.]|uniref:aspartate carbamoyltransferase n=1 Tax=Dongia sp. TaxID=1977262 RepID=UPI0037506675